MVLVLAFLGVCQLHFSVLKHLQCCILLSGPVFVALWVACVVSSRFSVAYACPFTFAPSFTLLSVRSIFVDGVFLVFPLPPLPIVLVFSLNSCSV